ncbi:MAG: O-antigen ligase family protein [Desulfobacteraceae bacterium]|nr:O-antigen ligase family protein [Desulfobacteraceae bacterium]
MEGVTLAIALAASSLVFFLSPVYGLIVYVAAFAWYPSYLSVQLGTLDFTVRRIVIIAVLLRLFLLTDLPGRFKLIWLDKLVLIYFAATILAGATTTRYLTAFFVNRSGQVFDTILPYFAVRMIITTKERYLVLLKGILVIAAPLAIVGFYQCLTGNNPVGFLKQYGAWITSPDVPWSRAGFFRSDVTFSHFIMFGLFFAMFGPVCAGLLRNVKKYKMLYWIGLGLMGLGIFSSMSAGPVLVALFAISFISIYRWRRHWRLITAAVILMCVCVEIISNRHFYEVIDRFTFSGGSAWYRSKLIEVGIFEGGMSGHWITGYGWGVDPGWSAKIDFRKHTDLGANQYLAILSGYGLVGLVPFLAMNIGVAKRLVEAYKASSLDADKWMIWCLSAGFFGLAAGFMAVSIFGQPTTIYYMMLGFAAMMPTLVTRPNQMISQLNTIGGNKQKLF